MVEAVMVRMLFGLALIAFLTVASLYGCVAPPVPFQPDAASGFKRVGLVVYTPDERPYVFDHSYILRKSTGRETYYSFLFRSRGSGLDAFKMAAPISSVRKLVEQGLMERFSKRYEVVSPLVFSGGMPGSGATKEEPGRWLAGAKAQGFDTLLVVECWYGLGTYPGERPSATVNAWVNVNDVATQKVVFRKAISSCELFGESRTIKELAANKAELFKQDIEKASDALCILIEAEINQDQDLLHKKPFEAILSGKISCSNPYRFDHDCWPLLGARRRINIEGRLMLIAGSNDGKNVMLTGCRWLAPNVDTTMDSALVDKTQGLLPAVCLDAAREEWAKKDIHVLKTIRIVDEGDPFNASDPGFVVGYAVELDGDGYSVLKQFSTGTP
jgi:hypothetical protein